jgi:hypothetical protein
MLEHIANNHDTIELPSIIDLVVKEPRLASLGLTSNPSAWPNTPLVRKVIGDLAHKGNWLKRIDYSRKAFEFALPHLPPTGTMKTRLASLWDWIQSND